VENIFLCVLVNTPAESFFHIDFKLLLSSMLTLTILAIMVITFYSLLSVWTPIFLDLNQF